jgi:hypothetical protein
MFCRKTILPVSHRGSHPQRLIAIDRISILPTAARGPNARVLARPSPHPMNLSHDNSCAALANLPKITEPVELHYVNTPSRALCPRLDQPQDPPHLHCPNPAPTRGDHVAFVAIPQVSGCSPRAEIFGGSGFRDRRACAAGDRRHQCARPPGRHRQSAGVARPHQYRHNPHLRSSQDAARRQPDIQGRVLIPHSPGLAYNFVQIVWCPLPTTKGH